MKSRRGFTLIELLVVIAIIAILAAILFPVFAQAKKSAKTTAAISNLKELAAASIMYASDNDDGMVISDHQPTMFQRPTWAYLLLPYTKNKQINWDPTRSIPTTDMIDVGGDMEGWDVFVTFSINDAGVSGVWSSPSCMEWPIGYAYTYGRNMGAQEFSAERMSFAPFVDIGFDYGYYFFHNFEASWVDMSQDYTDSSGMNWNEVWQSRLNFSGNKVPVAYLDGHASSVNGGKFVSWAEAPDRATYCQVMQNRNLFNFWGEWWNSTL